MSTRPSLARPPSAARQPARRAIQRDDIGRVARPAEVGGALDAAARRACQPRGVGRAARAGAARRCSIHASIVLRRAVRHGAAADLAQRRRCRSRPSACRTPALRPPAGRTPRAPTAAARARCAGRPPPASTDRRTAARAIASSSTELARASTRCSAVNGPPTRISRTSGRCPAHAGDDVEQHVDPLARDRAADVQQIRRPARVAEQARRLDVGGRLRHGRAARMRAVGNHRQLVRAGSKPAWRTSASRVASLSHATCAAARSPDRIRRVIARNGGERRSCSGSRTDRNVSRSWQVTSVRPAGSGARGARSCGRRCERGRSGRAAPRSRADSPRSGSRCDRSSTPAAAAAEASTRARASADGSSVALDRPPRARRGGASIEHVGDEVHARPAAPRA